MTPIARATGTSSCTSINGPGSDAGVRASWRRILIAVCIGAAAGTYCYAALKAFSGPRQADDFTWYWLGARALLEGKNPYDVIHVGGRYALDAPFVYPLTTAMAIIPFAAWLAPVEAAAVFIAVSSALLAWGITSDGYKRLPIFLSIPFIWVCNSGQISPLIAASALVPALGWLAPVKPNLGLATIAYRPSRIAILGSIVFVVASFALNPHWLSQWLATFSQSPPGAKRIPITILGGPVVLLAVLRWKRPEARLLLVLVLVPQSMLFYDQLLLWLVPATMRQSILLGMLSVVVLVLGEGRFAAGAGHADVTQAYAPLIIALLFLPCLIMILLRPNEGQLPTWSRAASTAGA